jgi:hypothetical protein
VSHACGIGGGEDRACRSAEPGPPHGQEREGMQVRQTDDPKNFVALFGCLGFVLLSCRRKK